MKKQKTHTGIHETSIARRDKKRGAEQKSHVDLLSISIPSF